MARAPCLVQDGPRCNLHVFGPGLAEVVRHRIFRDWLSEHPEDLERYRDAKLDGRAEATSAGEHVMDYNARKEPVIREIYDRAFRAARAAAVSAVPPVGGATRVARMGR